jgi:hypothetical protein
MSGPRGFIARWSRRKRAAATPSPLVGEGGKGGGADSNVGLPVSGPPPPTHKGEGSTPSAHQDCDPNAPETAPRAGPVASEISFDVTKLPPIESITAETDIRAFLAPGVPLELTRAALRRAWAADPKIREFIGLSENAWDFNAPDAMAGFGPLEMTDELRRQITAMVGRGLGEEALDEPSHPPIETLGAQEKLATALPQPRTQRIPERAQAPIGSNIPERTGPAPQRNIDHIAGQSDPAKQECAQPIAKRRHGRALPE